MTNSSPIEYTKALDRGRKTAATEMRARAVRYLADRDAIEIDTAKNGRFLIPRAKIDVLQKLPPNELAQLEVWPDGSAIELEVHDIQISVDGLLSATKQFR